MEKQTLQMVYENNNLHTAHDILQQLTITHIYICTTHNNEKEKRQFNKGIFPL